MRTTTIEVPAMYADHHVQEVRKLLLEISGVEDVYASSAFQAVEVTYDPKKIKVQEVKEKLEDEGYLGDLALPVEADASTYLDSDRSQSYFRHTEVFEGNKDTVSFAQNVSFTGRPLWHCPGFGVIKEEMEE